MGPMTALPRTQRPLQAVLACSVALLAAAALTGCGQGSSPAPTPAATTAPETASSGTTPPSAADLAGRTIAIDPGHNGGNAQNPEAIARQVPDGRGGTKACNTTGTATDGGYTESEFAWSVARLLADDLEASGATVIMSRDGNDGVGPCVDERGAFAEAADALVSIHANGSDSTRAKGFHLIVADPGSSPSLEERSYALAASVSRSLAESFTPNPAYGEDAVSPRPDLAGLNTAPVPAIIVECGEMRNPDDAAAMESADGRQRYAEAIANGVGDWLRPQPTTGAAPVQSVPDPIGPGRIRPSDQSR